MGSERRSCPAEPVAGALVKNWDIAAIRRHDCPADLHWRLIADAMGQRDAVFTDASGVHVHPATCAFSLAILHPHAPEAGDTLDITSNLRRASRTRLLSIHDMMLNGAPFARFMMTSAFVTAEGGARGSCPRAGGLRSAGRG